jgi:hypothetical protein
MSLKIRFLFVSLILAQAFNGCAQNHEVLFDVFANKAYSYQKKYKEVKDFELNLNDEIDIEYFAMRNEQGINYDKMNRYLESMALNEWKDKQKKFELSNEIKAKIVDYNTLKYRNNSRYAHGIENDFNAQLKSIDINILSVCNHVITFFQNYEYKVLKRSDNYGDNEIEINITKYYTVDIYTQNIIPLKAVFKDANIDKVEQEILPLINKYVHEIKEYFEENPDEEPEQAEYDDESDIGYHRKDDINKSKVNDKVAIKDADFYWFGWGLMLKFPDYCKSSYVSNGESFSVFIPFDQCKATIDLFPSYDSFKQLIKPAHQFSNFDYFEVLNDYNKFRYEPAVTSLFKLNNVIEKPKKLTASSYQTFKNNSRNFRGDFIYEFNQNAKNFQQQAAKTTYSYYLENNDGKSSKSMNKAATQKANNIYDEKGNLILRKAEEPIAGSDYYYFYNLDNCYSFSTVSSRNFGDETITKTSFSNGELCLTDVCLTFNKNMQVVAIKMLKYQHNDIELGFDDKGRLVEGHTENDRYNYYFEFDIKDRLIKHSIFEYQRVSKEVIYFYKEEQRLPYLQKKHTYNNEIFEEESYNWEY